MQVRMAWLCVGMLMLGTATGCVNASPEEEAAPVGTLAAALSLPAAKSGVTAVRFDVVPAGGACEGQPVASHTFPLEQEMTPASEGGSAGAHRFAGGVFVLAVGDYKVCATPLAEDGAGSAACARAEGTASILEGKTSGVALVSQCTGLAMGTLDVSVALNDPPHFTEVAIQPSKYITVCESANVNVVAVDPDGDVVEYRWAVAEGATGARLSATAGQARFSAPTPGDYVLVVSAMDVHAGQASLTIPVHVSDAVCELPAAVHNIIVERCSPCHITAASGGLSMATPAIAYANLVGKPSAAAACADRTRVVAGDPATRYLVAKLRNQPPICGVPMPRGRPMLAEAELAAIEAWIAGLPH